MLNRIVMWGRDVLIAITCVVVAAAARGSSAPRIDFNRDVRPVLSENCFFCHGTDANKRKAGLRLDVREAAIEKGAVVPGQPDRSELVSRIFSRNPDEQMPPAESHRQLSAAQKDVLREWIKQGASYDTHWAFKRPNKAPVPTVQRGRWVRNEIDSFVLARLESEQLRPASEALLDVLIRRASFDLTGLPPTAKQLAAWHRARDPYGTAVNDLLASAAFGERMAVDWMDVSRYADTHGFNNDSLRSMWRWRDWVIEAFNRNLPYDQFITEQLAGDLLPSPTLDQRIATGFNRNHVINSEGGIIDEEYRVEYVADRLQTTALAWMGLTVGCARCHDHKFDPLTQRDYYRLFAFFNNIDEHGEDGRIANASPIMPAPTRAQQKQMREHQAEMQRSVDAMQKMIRSREWQSASFRSFIRSNTANVVTNRVLALEPSDADRGVFSNLAGGKPFLSVGANAVAIVTNCFGNALTFPGATHLRSAALPKFDAGKGWALSSWVRRDEPISGTIFSSMDFSVPASSQSYGQGVEVRLTDAGAVDVRIARRWPAYSVNVVTRELIRPGEWRHVLVTCDGGTAARGVHVFIDGVEAFRDVVHDDLLGSVGIAGPVLIGASAEQGSSGFRGAMANVCLLSRPVDSAHLAKEAREHVLSIAAAEANPSAQQIGALRAAWMEHHVEEFARLAHSERKARAALLDLERDAPTTMVMRKLPTPRPTFVLFRGQHDSPRERVEPGVPEFVLPFPEDAPRNRLGLARWLTDPRNPLTARVVVNRLWQSFFGNGLVKSVEDFGFQAEYPSHAELLDWLAVDFIEHGWDMKHLVRLIVNSATYRQDSRSTPALNERDPENRLLARGPRQRLTAEMLRDQALAVSGLLKEGIGGPPVFPYQPTNLYKGIIVAADYPGTSYVESTGDGLYRRSLYTFWKRTVPHPTLATFDAPDREVCVARRLKTNTPLQALALMNDTIQLEAARQLAERMMKEGGKTLPRRIAFAFRLLIAREPERAEIKLLSGLFEKRLASYRAEPTLAAAFLSGGAFRRDENLDIAELAAYAQVASVILNLDEAITRN